MKTIQVSYSEISDMRRCSAKHEWGWRYGYRKQHRDQCDCALCFGIAWHNCLEAFYKGLARAYVFRTSSVHDYRGGWHAACDQIEHDCPEHLKERIRWMLEGYAAHYGKEEGWKVCATEHKLIVPLPQIYKDLKVLLKVKIDLIIKDPNGKLWVDDHKTCGQLPHENKMVDPQLPLYMYALRRAGGSWPAPFGARYSYALKPPKTMQFRKQRTLEERFRRRMVAHTDREIRSIARDCYITVYTRYKEAELFDKPPRSVTPDCSFCDYRTPCLASRKGYDLDRFMRDENIIPYRTEPKVPVEGDQWISS